MPVLLTGASLIGFVAFAGGVIVWTRFSAAKVPPDQAVNAVPRDELVAIGSAILLLFGFFGVLALVGAFLVDRGARATPGMARWLLAIFLVEAVTATIVAEGLSIAETIAAAELILLPVLAAAWATFSERFVSLEDDLPTRAGVERPGPRRWPMFLLPGTLVMRRPGTAPTPTMRELLARFLLSLGPILVAAGCLAVAVAMVWLGASPGLLLVWLSVAIVAFLAAAVLLSWEETWLVRDGIAVERSRAREEDRGRAAEPPAGGPIETAIRKMHGREADEDDTRLLNERPQRLVLKGQGVFVMGVLLLAAIGLPSLRLEAGWIAVSIAAAALLAAALWRISTLSARRVIWYGMAVFLSVPLYGTLTAMARNIDDPQVQPMALIRTTDGPDEAIQGLYVTEADDRVYFATVATEGCSDELTSGSGRLEWVPKSEVVAMSVGPLQNVKDAAASALEMAYALTPAVETPAGAGSEAGLTAGDEPATEAPLASASGSLDKRLEDAGPAVRPFYGAGLSLTPENASPGETVTLRMGAPNTNEKVQGFGRTRNGHTVRVGGVRATILKQYAHRADTAEYVETEQGMLLRLEKSEPYVIGGNGGYELLKDLDSRPEDPRFLKLVDHRVLRAGGKKMGEEEGEGDEEGIYLSIGSGAKAPFLENPDEEVTLRGLAAGDGKTAKPQTVALEPRPKAQAWHEREIKFVVPENVSTGAVTVECSQLAGQPLLRVAHAPEARMSVRMQAGSTRVSFDSSRSSDADEEEISRRWSVAGLQRGNLPRMSVDLPPRPRAYTVRMTATDESGRKDTAELRLLRLPASLFKPDAAKPHNDPVLREARETLEAAAAERTPAAIEIDGYADDPGNGRHNVHLSLRRAERVRERLLHKPEVSVPGGAAIQVRTLAYGDGCPVELGSGRSRANRRVDVFVLEQGISMAPPVGCHPRRLQSTEWKLPPEPPETR